MFVLCQYQYDKNESGLHVTTTSHRVVIAVWCMLVFVICGIALPFSQLVIPNQLLLYLLCPASASKLLESTFQNAEGMLDLVKLC